MTFLAGRDRYTQRTLFRDKHDRLTRQAGCENIRYRPSRRRPQYVVADIDPAVFLGDSYDTETVRLEIRFWYPANVEHAYYRINWIEPDRSMMFGFHQDASHPELGLVIFNSVIRTRRSIGTVQRLLKPIHWRFLITDCSSSERR